MYDLQNPYHALLALAEGLQAFSLLPQKGSLDPLTENSSLQGANKTLISYWLGLLGLQPLAGKGGPFDGKWLHMGSKPSYNNQMTKLDQISIFFFFRTKYYLKKPTYYCLFSIQTSFEI